jgi:hypothetical protein
MAEKQGQNEGIAALVKTFRRYQQKHDIFRGSGDLKKEAPHPH